MRIGIIHDFHVKRGGGDFVMLNILEALIKTYEVTLITSRPLSFYEACKSFNKEINDVRINKIKGNFLVHPYSIAYMASRVAKEKNYDVFVLADDVPRCLSKRCVLTYVHYLHAARLKFGRYVMQKYSKTLIGKVQWQLHKKLFPCFFPTQSISGKWFLLMNSMVTMHDSINALELDPKKVALLNPPVSSAFINALAKNIREKEDLVVSIGWFEPLKGFNDVLHALALLKDKHRPTLRLIGFKGDGKYFNELVASIETLGIKKNVEVFPNAERNIVIDSLLKAKAIIHSALREHFGIAVVEGMAARAVPIVRRGFNGPWMEILQEGKYGIGFSTREELASAIERVVKNYRELDIEKIAARSLEFDEQRFQDKFLSIFEYFISTNYDFTTK
jgi:glycosyltransferase involved in cell wall biosynthesis